MVAVYFLTLFAGQIGFCLLMVIAWYVQFDFALIITHYLLGRTKPRYVMGHSSWATLDILSSRKLLCMELDSLSFWPIGLWRVGQSPFHSEPLWPPPSSYPLLLSFSSLWISASLFSILQNGRNLWITYFYMPPSDFSFLFLPCSYYLSAYSLHKVTAGPQRISGRMIVMHGKALLLSCQLVFWRLLSQDGGETWFGARELFGYYGVLVLRDPRPFL